MASVSLNALPSGTVEQVVHYYPFGGQFADGTSSSLQEFKFTGKEWDGSKGQNLYDFGARTYDPALLRWTTPDPLSSKYHTLPVKFEDRFTRAGINIHDPKYGKWIEPHHHLSNARSYNKAWGEFFKDNSEADINRIEQKMRQLMEEIYGM